MLLSFLNQVLKAPTKVQPSFFFPCFGVVEEASRSNLQSNHLIGENREIREVSGGGGGGEYIHLRQPKQTSVLGSPWRIEQNKMTGRSMADILCD